MKKYELLLVLPGTLDDKEAEAKTTEVVTTLKELSPDAELKIMGKNRLAYPIKQVRYGYFYTVIFTAEPETVKKIEEKLRLTRGLLRAVLTHYNKAMENAENVPFLGGDGRNEREEDVRMIEEEAPVVINEVKEEQTQEIATEEPVKEESAAVIEDIVVEEPKKTASKPKAKTLDLKEIDKKLDEILADDNINI